MSFMPFESRTFPDMQILETFVYYDCPRLFTAADAIGRTYLVVDVGEAQEAGVKVGQDWVLAPVDEEMLRLLKASIVTVRRAFDYPCGTCLLRIRSYINSKNIEEWVFPTEISDEDMPEEGVYLGAAAEPRPDLF